MSASLIPMPLALARDRANKVVAWLSPFCERIEIAGSIRRCCPLCNDIDIVAVPRRETRVEQADLLSTSSVSINLLREHLIAYVRDSAGASWLGRNEAPGPEPKPDAKNLLLVTKAGAVRLDVWCATPETFTTLFICRTGSRSHNIWAASRANDLGGHWSPYDGLAIHGQRIPLEKEADFYHALKMTPPLPTERDDIGLLNQLRHS